MREAPSGSHVKHDTTFDLSRVHAREDVVDVVQAVAADRGGNLGLFGKGQRFGQVQAGKLAWVSPISGRRMFVNRRGARFCVASPEQLATMVRLGRLRLHRDEDAFYSAMQSVVDSLDTPAAA